LLALQRLVTPLQRNRLLFFQFEGVHADNHSFVTIDSLLVFVRGVLDLLLDESSFDGLQRAAHGINLFQIAALLFRSDWSETRCNTNRPADQRSAPRRTRRR